MQDPIAMLGDSLAGAKEVRPGQVRGTRGGHTIEVRMVDRGLGSNRDFYTEVLVVGLARPDLFLAVIPQRESDMQYVARGQGTDHVLGDLQFDKAFLVEAAPLEVVRHLFTAELRACFVALKPVAIKTTPEGILIEKPEWVESPALLTRLVGLAADVASRVPDAYAAADRDRAERAGYRGGAQPSEIQGERLLEKAQTRKRQELRIEDIRSRSWFVVGAMAIVMGLATLLTVVLVMSC